MTPAELCVRIDLDLLHPRLRERVLRLLEQCSKDGADYFAISGYRTYLEQSALYFQGRTSGGVIVTNAQAGQSMHNFGLAVDLCRDGILDRRGLQPDYRPASYDLLGVNAPAVGLEWGGRWKIKDRPHVQIGRPLIPAQMRALRKAYETNGLLAAWEEFDNLTH